MEKSVMKINIKHKESGENVLSFVYFKPPGVDMVVELGKGWLKSDKVKVPTNEQKKFCNFLSVYGMNNNEIVKLSSGKVTELNFTNVDKEFKISGSDSGSVFFLKWFKNILKKNYHIPMKNFYEIEKTYVPLQSLHEFFEISESEFSEFLKDLKIMSHLELKTIKLEPYRDTIIMRNGIGSLMEIGGHLYSIAKDEVNFNLYVDKKDVSSKEAEDAVDRISALLGFPDTRELVCRGYDYIIKERSGNEKN